MALAVSSTFTLTSFSIFMFWIEEAQSRKHPSIMINPSFRAADERASQYNMLKFLSILRCTIPPHSTLNHNKKKAPCQVFIFEAIEKPSVPFSCGYWWIEGHGPYLLILFSIILFSAFLRTRPLPRPRKEGRFQLRPRL